MQENIAYIQGLRVKEIRELEGLSQEEFGNRFGVTRSSISNFEKGKRKMSEQTLRSICREFNIEYLWLKNGDGNMKPNQTDDDILAQIDVIMCGESTIHKNMIKSLVSLSEEQLLAIDAAIDKYITLKDGKK